MGKRNQSKIEAAAKISTARVDLALLCVQTLSIRQRVIIWQKEQLSCAVPLVESIDTGNRL